MAAPSMRLVRSVKKHRRHNETSLMRRNTDNARTSAMESSPCFLTKELLPCKKVIFVHRDLPDKSFESTNGELLRCSRRLRNPRMQSMGRGCSEPPSHALDGLLRSTPPQFAALGTIVAVIIIATVVILSLCPCSFIRAWWGVRV
jgi:hypothetical protein